MFPRVRLAVNVVRLPEDLRLFVRKSLAICCPQLSTPRLKPGFYLIPNVSEEEAREFADDSVPVTSPEKTLLPATAVHGGGAGKTAIGRATVVSPRLYWRMIPHFRDAGDLLSRMTPHFRDVEDRSSRMAPHFRDVESRPPGRFPECSRLARPQTRDIPPSHRIETS